MLKSYAVVLFFGVVIAFATANHILGGVKELQGDDLKEAEKTLNESLVKLAAGDGPHYTIGKITKATRQVVSGTKYTYEAELQSEGNEVKKCHVDIWSQPWLENGIQVTFNCDGEDELVVSHSA